MQLLHCTAVVVESRVAAYVAIEVGAPLDADRRYCCNGVAECCVQT